jgi:hypothetical protein
VLELHHPEPKISVLDCIQKISSLGYLEMAFFEVVVTVVVVIVTGRTQCPLPVFLLLSLDLD